MNNNELLKDEEIKKEAEKVIAEFTDSISKRTEEISRFTSKDLDKLLRFILDDCQDLTELENYTNILKNRIIENNALIEKFLYQKDLTKKDIINANIINFCIIYNTAYLVTRLLSPNILEFVNNFLATILIGGITFHINLNYFTSEKHKKQLIDNIAMLYKAIEINEYDIYTFNILRSLYIKELSYETKKLLEITKDSSNDDNYQRIKAFLDGLKIDFLLEEDLVKTKVKRK